MFCESIFKIFNFSRAAKKTTMRSDNAVVSGSIADRSNFMSDCKQMQVRLKNGKYINLAPVVQRLDNAIHRINRYPADKC